MTAQTNKIDGQRGSGWITAGWLAVATLSLLAPLVAMQFTDQVNWTLSDFALAGALLFGAGMMYELAARAGNRAYRAAAVVALAAAVLAIGVTGAVGIIGSEANPGNLLFLVVVMLAILGAAVARGRPAGMARAMLAAAAAQVLVPIIALFVAANPTSEVLSLEVFAATAFFAGLWLMSAWLFRRAAQDPSR